MNDKIDVDVLRTTLGNLVLEAILARSAEKEMKQQLDAALRLHHQNVDNMP